MSFAYLYNACSVKQKKGFPSIPFLSKFHSTAYKDGTWKEQQQPYRIPHRFGKDDWRSYSPTSLQEQVAQDLVQFFYHLQDIPEPLSVPSQDTYGRKKKISSYLITIFLCPNFVHCTGPYCLFSFMVKLPALWTRGEQWNSCLDHMEHYKSLYWDIFTSEKCKVAHL